MNFENETEKVDKKNSALGSVENQVINVESVDEKREKELRKQVESMRVNFEDASSIMNYGNDLMNEIAEVLYSISLNNEDMTVGNIGEYEQKITQIGNFTDSLQKEAEKSLKVPARAHSKFVKVFNNIFKTDLKIAEANFRELLDKQLGNINEVQRIFTDMLNEVKSNTTMSQEFIKVMNPYLELLDILIKVGYEDLGERKLMVGYWENQHVEEQIIVLEKTKLSAFTRKLSALNKNLVSYQQHQTKLNIGLYNKFEIAMNCQEILGNTLPQLRSEVISQVDAVLDKIKLQKQQELSEEVNNALIETAHITAQNTRDALQIAKDGIITVSTYEKVGKELQGTLKLINKTIMDDRNNQKEQEKLQKIVMPLQEEMSKLSSFLPNLDEESRTVAEEKAKILSKNYKDNKGFVK